MASLEPLKECYEAARCQAASLVCASTLKDVVLGLRQSTDGVSEDFTEQVLAPRARYWSSIKKDDSTQRNQSYPLLNKQQNLLGATVQAAATAAHQASDLADVKGHALARRALEIAAAGAHNLLLLGSPGTGKSLLAGALASILPPMSEQEALETAAIVSVSQGGFDASQYACRPFRSPHHTAPTAALIGGGARPMPGEISLAHNGVSLSIGCGN